MAEGRGGIEAPAFSVRALEIHNSRMWRWAAIAEAVDFMCRAGMNTLVLHQNDLIDQLVFPARYVTRELMYARWPVLRSTLVSNRLYLRAVIRAAAAAGIDVMLEVKEISFPESLIELRPELRSSGGAVCPTHPFWDAYIRSKVEDLYDALPGLGGLILSVATRESKTSLVTRACSCDRCASTEDRDWYAWVLRAFHEPLKRLGKPMAVRDFAYTSSDQRVLAAAVTAVSDQIVLAVKNVPHDFWPTFPNNPLLGRSGLREWAEFDVFGQYSGLAVVPCGLVRDLRSRLQHCRAQGVSGAIFRTDWEMIGDASAFNSLNMLNLHAAAVLSVDPESGDDPIYGSWLRAGITTGLQPESMRSGSEVPAGPGAEAELRRIMEATWPILERALFTRGHVFQYSSKIPPTLDEFFYVARTFHSRDDWDPGSLERVEPTRANVEAVLAEKRKALDMAEALRGSLQVEELGVSAELGRDIRQSLDLLVRHVALYHHAVTAAFLTALALRSQDPDDHRRAVQSVRGLAEFKTATEAWLASATLPFYVYWLFDTELLGRFEADLSGHLGEVAPVLLPAG